MTAAVPWEHDTAMHLSLVCHAKYKKPDACKVRPAGAPGKAREDHAESRTTWDRLGHREKHERIMQSPVQRGIANFKHLHKRRLCMVQLAKCVNRPSAFGHHSSKQPSPSALAAPVL
jgi:hypothetical protein